MAAKTCAHFEGMPFELIEDVLSYLDDYKDLRNAMCASRRVRDIFEATSPRLLARIARNIIEPEALQMALAAFYCNTDRLPCPPDQTLGTEDDHAKNGYPLYEFPFELSFPTQQLEITKFFHFCKTVNSVGEILISKFRAYNSHMLHRREDYSPFVPKTRADDPQRCHLGNRSPGDSLATLTTEERGRFQRKLCQYEFFARTLKHDQRLSHDLALNQAISSTWRERLLNALGVVESFQLFTIQDWVIKDYNRWERELQVSFAYKIVEANRNFGISLGLASPDADPITDIPPIVTDDVFRAEEVGNTIPHLFKYQQRHRREFLSMLQSFGLRFYKEVLEATPAKRNKLILRAHKMLDMRRHDRCRFIFSHHIPLNRMNQISQLEQEWADRVEREQVEFPNTYLKAYAKMTQGYRQSRIGSYGWYLSRTGWWFWDDQHLSRLDFKDHHILGEGMTPNSKSEHILNVVHASRQETNVHFTALQVIMARRKGGYALPQSDWEDILAEYKIEDTGLRDIL
ncbi:hypothetical protein F5Y03DRAFT_411012 [Xylaria venustula]|nr:hypothetical protein F5Y03DRAFT_411012 [Xylaria venustula]